MDEGNALWYNLAQPPSVGLAAPVERLLHCLLYTSATISSSFITHPRNMNDIAHNLAQVRDKISGAAARCGRAPEEVTLLAAVSYTHLMSYPNRPQVK